MQAYFQSADYSVTVDSSLAHRARFGIFVVHMDTLILVRHTIERVGTLWENHPAPASDVHS